MKRTSLYYQNAATHSDKVYVVTQSDPDAAGRCTVTIQHGKRGAKPITQIVGTYGEVEAASVFADKVAEKTERKPLGERYSVGDAVTPPGRPVPVPSAAKYGATMKLVEISEAELLKIIFSGDYVLQIKKDGWRMALEKNAGGLTGTSRQGLPIALPPAVAYAAAALPGRWALDGEKVGDHYYAFDLLMLDGRDLRGLPYRERLRMLGECFGHGKGAITVVESWFDADEKFAAFGDARANGSEGVVLKRLDAAYTAGKTRNALKYKFTATASAIVCRINPQRSVGVKFIDGYEIGDVTIPANHEIPQVDEIIEFRYLTAHRGGGVSQAVYLGVRFDVLRSACTASQLHYKDEARAN